MKRAVFLDRDGTINEDVDHLNDPSDVRLIPGAAEGIKKINNLGSAVVVVTNQSAIARGMLTEKALDEIHTVLIKKLSAEGAKVDALYYCPHHPEGIVKEYAIECECRKPNTGMIKKALVDLNLSANGGFMVGDATSDILAGARAGLRTILVKTGYGGSDKKYEVKPDFIATDLNEAADIILNNQ